MHGNRSDRKMFLFQLCVWGRICFVLHYIILMGFFPHCWMTSFALLFPMSIPLPQLALCERSLFSFPLTLQCRGNLNNHHETIFWAFPPPISYLKVLGREVSQSFTGQFPKQNELSATFSSSIFTPGAGWWLARHTLRLYFWCSSDSCQPELLSSTARSLPQTTIAPPTALSFWDSVPFLCPSGNANTLLESQQTLLCCHSLLICTLSSLLLLPSICQIFPALVHGKM